MYDLEQELETAKRIALQAGEIMKQYFDGDQQQETKEDGSPVTIADKKINQLVIEELSRVYPDDGIIGEELSTSQHGMGRKWICDPVDGTRAFTWGVPTATFSLGLVVDGQPVLGLVYDPFLNRLYTGRKDKAAFVTTRGCKFLAMACRMV